MFPAVELGVEAVKYFNKYFEQRLYSVDLVERGERVSFPEHCIKARAHITALALLPMWLVFFSN